MNRVFVTGDTHGSPDTLFKFYTEHIDDLTKDDYLIICGDFGFVWENEPTVNENYWLDWIDMLPWTTLFIVGNHENFPRINSFPEEEWHGGRVHRIKNSILHLITGEVFNIGDKKFFCYGGARSVDAAYRIPYKSWWPEEEPSSEDYRSATEKLEAIDFQPNYIITHEMPFSYVKEFYGSRATGSTTAFMLNDFLIRCYGYEKWYCGHHHVDAAVRPDFQICYKEVYEVM